MYLINNSGFFVLLALLSVMQAANILYINPTPASSHFRTLETLSLALAKRGHNITVIAAFSSKNSPLKNYTQIIAYSSLTDSNKRKQLNRFDYENLTYPQYMNERIWPGGLKTTEGILKNSALQNFMANKGNKYDLVICEFFIQEALLMFAPLYDAPLVLIMTVGNILRNNFEMGNPLEISYVVNEYAKIHPFDSFYGRLQNLCVVQYELFWRRVWYLPQQERLVDKYFESLPKNRPSIVEVQRNASLSLYNSHFSANIPTVYLPNIIQIGGIHHQESGTLPQDLQRILDDAHDGVIYMSFGSILKSTDLPKDKLNAFLNTFKRLKQTVLLKWEEPKLFGKPENVIARPWFPQNDILGHPNVKLFISHGGILGIQEAIYHGVPIIGIPIYGDQFNNIIHAEKTGFALLLPYTDITEGNVFKYVSKIITERTYKNRAKEVSARFRDRPMNGLDTAVYWIEYVLRNEGASFMKPSSQRVAWYSHYLLDIIAILIAIFVFVTYFFVYLLPRLLRTLLIKFYIYF